MLTAFIRAFRTPDLRKKLLFTIGIIALFRFGASLPAPGINEANVSTCAGVAWRSGPITSSAAAHCEARVAYSELATERCWPESTTTMSTSSGIAIAVEWFVEQSMSDAWPATADVMTS